MRRNKNVNCFREEIAAALCSFKEKRPVGLPSAIQRLVYGIGMNAKHPVADVCYDMFDHFPVWLDKQNDHVIVLAILAILASQSSDFKVTVLPDIDLVMGLCCLLLEPLAETYGFA
ncbi:hypothetical protein JTB14_026723 [Gonioctena quinquepunctata]|nr:hypothetical protein JTB14_026723 [Gonioctena quinquepunctata]